MKFLSFVLLFAPAAQADPFEDRVRQVISSQAVPANDGYSGVASRLWLHRDAEWCSRRITELVKTPTGDMFWMFPATAVAYLGRDQLSASAKAALRNTWKTYMPYRGDTENHWLLYYTSMYLMAQMYPNDSAETWFNGKSSRENFDEAESFILEWLLYILLE